MINALIIEDELAAQEQVLQAINNNYATKINVVGVTDSVNEGIQLIKRTNPELIFLDIELKDGLGFEILDTISNQNSFEVIFTSGHIDYREKAMEYFAFYFLNKPLRLDQFKRVIDRYIAKKTAFDFKKYMALKKQLTSEKKSIALPNSNGNFSLVHLDDLLYCEAAGSYTYYYTTNNEKFVSSNSLKKVERLLNDSSFYRISRSIFLNLKHVKKYNTNGKITLSNNKKVSVSVRNKKGFFTILKLMNYTLD